MRFRLKTDFLTYARDQIRGGLWYKPSWWDAVSKVPPQGFVPRIKKRDIPHIRFVEDRLIREFGARNPMIRAFEQVDMSKPDPRSVSALFADKQLAFMKANKTEAEAYDLARVWLLENGRDMFNRLAVPPAIAHTMERDPVTELPPKEMVEAIQEKQAALMREALQEDMKARELQERRVRRKPKLPPYRSFRSEEEIAAISQRTLGKEPIYPDTASSSDSVGSVSSAASSAAAAAQGGVAGSVPAGATAASSTDVLGSADADASLVAEVLSAPSTPATDDAAAAPAGRRPPPSPPSGGPTPTGATPSAPSKEPPAGKRSKGGRS